MQPPSTSQPVLPATWAQLLESVQATLHKTQQEAAKREQALRFVSRSRESGEEREMRWHQCLQDDRQEWQTALRQAEQEALAADAVLSGSEEALRRWLNAAAAAERRLAEWTGRAV